KSLQASKSNPTAHHLASLGHPVPFLRLVEITSQQSPTIETDVDLAVSRYLSQQLYVRRDHSRASLQSRSHPAEPRVPWMHILGQCFPGSGVRLYQPDKRQPDLDHSQFPQRFQCLQTSESGGLNQ